MQLNIPLGARHHYIALKMETNQSMRRPTSRSLLKLLVSGLYLKLFTRGSIFLLAPLGTVGPITKKPREKVELLFLRLLILSSLFFSSPYRIVWSKSSLESTFYHMSIPHWLLGLPLSPYPSTFGFLSNHVLPHVSYGSHLSSLFDLTCILLRSYSYTEFYSQA